MAETKDTFVDCDVHGKRAPWVICVHATTVTTLHKQNEEGLPRALICLNCVEGLADPERLSATQEHLRTACDACVADRFLHGTGIGKRTPLAPPKDLN